MGTGEKIQSCVIITGIGSLTGMKGFVELFTTCDVPDLSLYGIGSANNGKGTDGKEFGFDNRKLAKGSFFYISANPDKFKSFFGFAPDFKYTNIAINGNDAVEFPRRSCCRYCR